MSYFSERSEIVSFSDLNEFEHDIIEAQENGDQLKKNHKKQDKNGRIKCYLSEIDE